MGRLGRNCGEVSCAVCSPEVKGFRQFGICFGTTAVRILEDKRFRLRRHRTGGGADEGEQDALGRLTGNGAHAALASEKQSAVKGEGREVAACGKGKYHREAALGRQEAHDGRQQFLKAEEGSVAGKCPGRIVGQGVLRKEWRVAEDAVERMGRSVLPDVCADDGYATGKRTAGRVVTGLTDGCLVDFHARHLGRRCTLGGHEGHKPRARAYVENAPAVSDVGPRAQQYAVGAYFHRTAVVPDIELPETEYRFTHGAAKVKN